MYSEKVLDHFHNPRNVGEIARPTAVVEVTNPVCGDMLKLWVVVESGKITVARFKAAGCVPSVACGSWLTEAMQGRPLAELTALAAEQIEAGLDSLPAASHHAAVLAADALKQTLGILR